ncbi:MAG: hypothetical protein ABI809_14660 [Caldimonas sp.]
MPHGPTAPARTGDLRRVTPIDSRFGGGRGKPADRHLRHDELGHRDQRYEMLIAGRSIKSS